MSATESSRGSFGDLSVRRRGLGAGKGKLFWTGGWNMLGLDIGARVEENGDNTVLLIISLKVSCLKE